MTRNEHGKKAEKLGRINAVVEAIGESEYDDVAIKEIADYLDLSRSAAKDWVYEASATSEVRVTRSVGPGKLYTVTSKESGDLEQEVVSALKESDNCDVSPSELSFRVGFSKQAVTRALNRLIESGRVEVSREMGPAKLYRLTGDE